MQAEPDSPTSIIELPDWVPINQGSFAIKRKNVKRRAVSEGESAVGLLAPDPHGDDYASASGSNYRQSEEPGSSDLPRSGIDRRRVKQVTIPPDEDRIAKRQLTSWQLFMITLNGTLGTGLYWAGGRVLGIGGPVAAVLSFFLIGILSWMVMQCITEMLCMWPVPGALSVYVSTFVDEELGVAVGIAYWFTYSVSFSALIASVAEEVAFWSEGTTALFKGVVIFLVLPVAFTLINWCRIKIYGSIETGVGTAKIVFYITIAVLMFSIAVGAHAKIADHRFSFDRGANALRFDKQVSRNWGVAFITCLSQVAFAYVGVEIIAASALEAGWTRSKHRTDTELFRERGQRKPAMVSNTIRRASIWFPVVVTIGYTLGSLLVSFNVPSNHCDLPRMSYIDTFECVNDDLELVNRTKQSSTSAFTIAARMSGIPHLDDVINSFLVFTALFSASTNLYVASRTLFALTSNIQGGPQQKWFLRWIATLGKTNRDKVPLRAVLFSAAAFTWVPPLQLITGIVVSYGKFTEVLAGMGSVGVLIVWFCNVWAYLNFFYATKRFRAYRNDELEKYPEANRDHPDYPYKAHQQPHFAWITLFLLTFVLIVANGASIWMEFSWVPFLTAYLTIASFIGLWLFLKARSSGQWFVDLSKPELLAKKIRRLNDTRYRALEKGVRNPDSRWKWR